MLFAIGTKVRLKNTGDEGVINEVLGNGMFSIYLEAEDMEIPAFEDNLMRIDAKTNTAQFVPAKQEKTETPPERPMPQIQYQRLSSEGVLLAFDPEYNMDGTTKEYVIHCVNDTSDTIIFDFELFLEDESLLKTNGQIAAHSIAELGELLGDELNEHPQVEINLWKVTTEGTSAGLSKQIKIKPKQFFKNLKNTLFFSKKVHLYQLAEKLEAGNQDKKSLDNLKQYTKLNARSFKPKRRSSNPFYRVHDVMEYAEFEPEIDLHIERLVKSTKGMDARQIVHIQMQHFHEFLAKAIRIGVPSVFVIHGVGEGKLRDRIAKELAEHPQVRSFKNEYHHRYGFGATEVLF